MATKFQNTKIQLLTPTRSLIQLVVVLYLTSKIPQRKVWTKKPWSLMTQRKRLILTTSNKTMKADEIGLSITERMADPKTRTQAASRVHIDRGIALEPSVERQWVHPVTTKCDLRPSRRRRIRGTKKRQRTKTPECGTTTPEIVESIHKGTNCQNNKLLAPVETLTRHQVAETQSEIQILPQFF